MRTTELKTHNGCLEGIVREVQTDERTTRFRLESRKDDEDYYCFGTDLQWLRNGEYADINFSGNYSIQTQLDEKIRARGREIFKQKSLYPAQLEKPHPIQLLYIEVFELRLYEREGGALLHAYKAAVRLGG